MLSAAVNESNEPCLGIHPNASHVQWISSLIDVVSKNRLWLQSLFSPMTESFDPYRDWLQISTEERPPNHYALLGIPLFESDHHVIRNAALDVTAILRQYQLSDKSSEATQIANAIVQQRKGAPMLTLLHEGQIISNRGRDEGGYAQR